MSEPDVVLGDPHGSCRIIVDSTGDFTPEVLEKLNVDMLSFPYILDGEEYLDDIWQSITPKEFYDKIRNGAKASTAAVSAGRYFELFQACADEGTPTIYICLTSGLSSSYSVAASVGDKVRELNPGFELYVLDSGAPSATCELLTIEAVRLRDAGRPAKEIASWITEAKYFIHGYFTLENLDQLAAGGRIPPAAAQLTGRLDVKVELSYDFVGALTLVGINRGRKKALRSLVNSFEEDRDPNVTNMPAIIVTADAEKDGDWVEDAVRKIDGCEDMVIIRGSVGPILGSHVGPGMVGFGFWGKDRREQLSLSDRIAKKVRGSDGQGAQSAGDVQG